MEWWETDEVEQERLFVRRRRSGSGNHPPAWGRSRIRTGDVCAFVLAGV